MAPKKEISFNIFCVFYFGFDIKLLYKEQFSYVAYLYLFPFCGINCSWIFQKNRHSQKTGFSTEIVWLSLLLFCYHIWFNTLGKY